MMGALLYLQVLTTRNRLVSQVRRLRQPKYLAGFLVGGLYFFFYFIRPIFFGGPGRSRSGPELPPELTAGLETLGAAVLLIIVLSAWVFPNSRAALTFSEAETTFLFPAPVGRRTLIHFKLLRSQAGILFTTLVMAFLSNRFGGSGGSAWIHLAGWWLILSMINLHFIGASFARTRLLDLGISHWRRRVIVVGIVILSSTVAWWWMQTHVKPPAREDVGGFKELIRYAQQFVGTQPLATILLPFQWTVRPYLAGNAVDFLRAAWPAALLLFGHYLWVIRSDVAFEEASVDLARQRAERLAVIRREPGKAAKGKARPAPFVLSPVGPPAVALLWKNLIGAGSLFTGRMWVLLSISFGIPAVMVAMNARHGEISVIVAMLLVMGLFWSVLLGPQLFRQDFRQDLRSAELLKLYPLPGWKIVLGELLAPAVILSAIQWLLLALLVILFSRIPGGREIAFHERFAVGLGAVFVCPAVNMISLLIPNASVLLFPAWLQTGPGGPQGIEATGQRLIFVLGQLFVFLVALLPAAVVAIGLFMLLTLGMEWPWVIPLSGLASAVVLLAEAGVAVWLLGKLFERLDVAGELRS